MNRALFWFDASFDEFLSPDRRGGKFTYHFNGNPSLKHLVEAMRVPHTEVGRIIVNDVEVGLNYLAQDGDHVRVYPALHERSTHTKLYADHFGYRTSGQPRFILDNHLGKLASYLRMLGFDTLYRNDYQDDELASIARDEQRILLTRDRGLLMRRVIEYGYCLRSMDARKQVIEVMQRYGLFDQIRPFQRCLLCNGLLRPVDKASIVEQLEPLTIKYYEEFCLCQQCGQIYWKGSHYERMYQMINELKSQN